MSVLIQTCFQLQTMENNITEALNCLNYIIWLVVFFSAALALKSISYLIAFVSSVLFAVIVNNFMKRQINKVNMAESLKAVE